MKKISLVGLIVLIIVNTTVFAFSTIEEQIDNYLGVLESSNAYAKIELLESLKWKGIADPRLYDEIEKQVIEQYKRNDQGSKSRKVLSYAIRALAYSGNKKYKNTLNDIKMDTAANRYQRHASTALQELDRYEVWNRMIADAEISIEGKSIEVENYMRMLNVNASFVQRLAGRGIFHERLDDEDLLKLIAEKLKKIYLQKGLHKEQQDVAAWFCKILGQTGISEYISLVSEVAENTPHNKIKRHAIKYAN